MNILLCSEGARPEAGGLGLVAVPYIARALAARGHRVTVEIFGPPIPGSEEVTGPSLRDPSQENLAFDTHPAAGRYALSVRGFAAVMHHARDADFVMLHSLYSFAVLSGFLAARRYGIKYGLWPHGVLAPFQRAVGARKKSLYDRLWARRILEGAAILFYNAVGERNEAAPLRLSAPSVIIPHGLDSDPFEHLPPRGKFRARWMNGFNGPLVLYLGRLNAKKGLDILIEALRLLQMQRPGARLAIVGAGDPPKFGEQVAGWVQAAGLMDSVVMPGLLMGEDKLSALADADIFVLPSHAENFSFALFEAMAARLPVVISDTLNFAPQVERARAGEVVGRAPEAFCGALVRLVDSPELRRQEGGNGAQLAARFSWSTVGGLIERAIAAVVRNQPLPLDLFAEQFSP